TPPFFFASTMAYIRAGLLSETDSPMRPSLSASLGRPFVICLQLLPPSVDLYRPLPLPLYAPPVVQGGRREAHISAKTTCELRGSKTRSMAPVSSSLVRTF